MSLPKPKLGCQSLGLPLMPVLNPGTSYCSKRGWGGEERGKLNLIMIYYPHKMIRRKRRLKEKIEFYHCYLPTPKIHLLVDRKLVTVYYSDAFKHLHLACNIFLCNTWSTQWREGGGQVGPAPSYAP